jgi:hypothetical protein
MAVFGFLRRYPPWTLPIRINPALAFEEGDDVGAGHARESTRSSRNRGHGPLLREIAGMARSYAKSRAWPAPTRNRGHGPLLREIAGMARSYVKSRAWPTPTRNRGHGSLLRVLRGARDLTKCQYFDASALSARNLDEESKAAGDDGRRQAG